VKNFFEHSTKNSPKNYLPFEKLSKKFHAIMTSMTLFTQSQNRSNFIQI